MHLKGMRITGVQRYVDLTEPSYLINIALTYQGYKSN